MQKAPLLRDTRAVKIGTTDTTNLAVMQRSIVAYDRCGSSLTNVSTFSGEPQCRMVDVVPMQGESHGVLLSYEITGVGTRRLDVLSSRCE